MKDILINPETAKLAREKGLNIPTLYGYNKKEELQKYFTHASYTSDEPEIRIEDFIDIPEYQLPTQSLLQKLLREIYDVKVWVEPIGKGWRFWVRKSYYQTDLCDDSYDNYEKALEMGLQKGLELL
jgi:hypothetical protein